MSEARLVRALGWNALLIALYFVVGTISLRFAQDTGLAAPVWPAAGIAFAFVFLRGWSLLPGVAIGSVLVNFVALASAGESGETATAIVALVALGATIEALLGAWLVRRYVGRRPSLTRPGQVIRFMALAGLLAGLAGATFGVASQLLGGTVPLPEAPLVWLTWWVGDAIGVIVFAPLTMMFMPGQAEVWHGRRWKLALPSLLVLVVALASFVMLSRQEASQLTERMQQHANSVASALQENLIRHDESLQGVRSLFYASQGVTRQEFAEFTKASLGRLDGLQALSWNPIVPATDLAAFERRMQTQEGVPDFQVFERDSAGDPVPVGPRDDYVVVAYIEPSADNEKALGFDIQSNPVRAKAIAAARATKQEQATAPIDLVQESGTQKGTLVLLPILDQRTGEVTSFAVGVFRLGDLLADTASGPAWAGWDIRLTDVTPGEEPVELAYLASSEVAGDEHSHAWITAPSVVQGGRVWKLAIRPTDGTIEDLQQSTPPVLLLGGLLLLGILEAFLLVVTGTERMARREAEASTYEANHDALTGLLNRRGFLEHLEIARQRAETEGSPQMLLFLDLDGFKAVNDSVGHIGGDDTLRGVADRLRHRIRERDSVGRIGGDEFAVILNNCDDERAMHIAQGLIDAVNDFELTVGAQVVKVGTSIGIAPIAGGRVPSASELLRRADDACYRAKHDGKGVVRVHGEPAAGVAESI